MGGRVEEWSRRNLGGESGIGKRDYDYYSKTSDHVRAIICMRKRANNLHSKALREDDNDLLVQHSTVQHSAAEQTHCSPLQLPRITHLLSVALLQQLYLMLMTG
jgi:hypothetical protein